jgi:prolyl-tRNA synthetase
MPNGRIIEGPCFHHDGQNFAKAYDIKFLDEKEKENYVWQNTFAISTRMLGALFVIHSDDNGLIIPPKIAENKIVIIPIFFDKTKEKVLKVAKEIKEQFKELNPILDDRTDFSPGWKYNEWELKGIPIRIEIGPRDLENKSAIVVKRNTSEKQNIKIKELGNQIPKLLDDMQKELLKNAKKLLKQNQKKTEDKKELIQFIKQKQMVLVPMCKSEKCEDILKSETSGAKTLFIDSKNPSATNKKCIICNKPADYWVYVGKTY